jgi:hypothetical protein
VDYVEVSADSDYSTAPYFSKEDSYG